MKENAIQFGFLEEKEYEVIGGIGMGIALPSNSTSYKVKIEIGDFELETSSPKESKKGYNRWSERW